MATQLKITQTSSSNRCLDKQVLTLKALGLRRIRQSVVHKKSPALQGMIKIVAHLVKVEEVSA